MVYSTAYTYHNYNSPFRPENNKKKKKPELYQLKIIIFIQVNAIYI